MLADKVGLYPDTIQLYNGQVSKVGEHDVTVTEAIIESGKNIATELV